MHTQTTFFRLKVVSPLHIGCDEVYEPTSFVIDEQREELISFEPFTFLKKLDGQDRQKFSAICQKGTIASLLEIYKFIRLHADKAEGERVAVSPNLVEHYRETLNLPDNERRIQQELNNFLISRTAFSPLYNLPYVPGSAVKGAIRTAVLNLRNQGRNQPHYHNSRALQEGLLDFQFNKMETDPFRLVKISDFVPVSRAHRRIAYAVDCKKRPSEREAQALHQILETVEPGAEFIGTISVTKPDSKAGVKKPIEMAELRKALQAFYQSEKTREDRELLAIGVGAVAMAINDSSYSVRIGRHSGAECVTVLGRRKIKIMQGKGNPSKEKDQATTIWLAANSKKPQSNKYLRPFGWVVLEEISKQEWQDLLRQGDDLTKERFDQLQERAVQEEKERKSRRARLAREQAERDEAERLLREKEEDERLNPWKKKLLPSIHAVTDWGQLDQKMKDAKLIEYQALPEIAQALRDVAAKVRDNHKKKWTPDRDAAVAEWLQPSGIAWEPLAKKNEQTGLILSPEEQAAVDMIEKLSDWGAWKNAHIALETLPLPAWEKLRYKFKVWGCDGKKAKDDKKQAWKNLNILLRQG